MPEVAFVQVFSPKGDKRYYSLIHNNGYLNNAQMFKEAEKGAREVNHERTDDILDANPEVVATGCPFCNTMMTDGVKNAERESSIEVKDIAELIAEAADLL